MDLRPSLDPIFRDFGLVATITPPGEPSVATTAVWILPQTIDMPIGAEARVAEPRFTLALRRSEVPSVPRDSAVVVAERAGEPERSWRVDGFGRVGEEIIEVLLVPV